MTPPADPAAAAEAPAHPSSRRWPNLSRRAWTFIGIAVLAVIALALVRVTITYPRVTVRWQESVTPSARAALERQYDLRAGSPEGQGTTWRYDLADSSQHNIRALVNDPSVADTGYIDRDTLTSEGRVVSVRVWYPFNDLFERPEQLLRLHRSAWLLLAGLALLWTAQTSDRGRRRSVTVTALLFVGTVSVTVPFDPGFVTMGGSADHVRSREEFQSWFGGRVRVEKHLSQVILLEIYERIPPTEAAPEQAVMQMTRLATAWFVACALAIGLLEGWSPLVVRYIALVLLAPAALLYFGWRELGYMSLSVAAFPLVSRGLRNDSMRLEAGSACAGIGAALHGSGLVSVAGVWLAALGAPGSIATRTGRVLRVTAWATAAWLGWMAIYVIVMKMPLSPDAGVATYSPWRPWFADDVRLGRVVPAIFTATGARDLLMSAWIAGAPLVLVALSLWRRYRHEVRSALWYLPPSLLFLLFRWPFDGVGGGMDLVVAGFPALYALAWACAHDSRRANVAAALLLSAHYAFWRVVLDDSFDTMQVD